MAFEDTASSRPATGSMPGHPRAGRIADDGNPASPRIGNESASVQEQSYTGLRGSFLGNAGHVQKQ
jgi:hypothetical protein